MKFLNIRILLLSAGLFMVFTASAQEQKIAVVNLQQVISSVPQADAARKEFIKQAQSREKKLHGKEAEIKSLREKLTRDALTMSASDKADTEQKLIRKTRELKWDQGIYQEDLKIIESQMMKTLKQLVIRSTVNMAKENKYDLVMAEGVLYSSNQIDITQKIIDKLKKEYTAKK